MHASIHSSVRTSIHPPIHPRFSCKCSIMSNHPNSAQWSWYSLVYLMDIWWIFVCIPTQQRIFWSRRSNICCEVGVCLCWSGQSAGSVDSLPVGCKRACQTTSVTKKTSYQYLLSQSQPYKIDAKPWIPWNFKCNSSISAFGKHGKILLISPDIWADAAVPEKTWPLTKAKVARARADRADRADAADAADAMARDLRHRSWLGLAEGPEGPEGPDRIRSALWCLCCIAMLDSEIQTYANHGSETKTSPIFTDHISSSHISCFIQRCR